MQRTVGTGGPEEWPCGAPFSSEEGGPFSDIENSSDEGSPFSDVEDDSAGGWDSDEALGQQQQEEPEPEPEPALMSKPDSTERLLRERIANNMSTRAERMEHNQQTATTPANSAVAGGLRLVASMLAPPIEFDLAALFEEKRVWALEQGISLNKFPGLLLGSDSKECDIRLPLINWDPEQVSVEEAIATRQVSQAHALLFEIPGGCRIQDNGSRDGIFVNGVKVHAAELQPGDRLVIGYGAGISHGECLTATPAPWLCLEVLESEPELEKAVRRVVSDACRPSLLANWVEEMEAIEREQLEVHLGGKTVTELLQGFLVMDTETLQCGIDGMEVRTR